MADNIVAKKMSTIALTGGGAFLCLPSKYYRYYFDSLLALPKGARSCPQKM